MDDYTRNSGHVSVPTTQYVSQEAYFAQQTTNTYPHGKHDSSLNNCCAICFGVFLLLCSALSIAGWVLAFLYYAAYSEIGTGIWCAAMFVAAGAVGIAAGCKKTDCLISGTTATSVFAIIFGITLVSISTDGLIRDLTSYDCSQWCTKPNSYTCACIYEDWMFYAALGNSLMISAGSGAIFFAFALSIVGCCALCKKSPQVVPTAGQPMTVQYIPAATQPMNPNQQYVQVPIAPNQPPVSQPSTVFQAPIHNQPDDHHHGDDHV